MSNKKTQEFTAWIISGPSGSGKTTLSEALLKDARAHARLLKSVSCTTRPMRAGEAEGKDYTHLSEEAFKALLKKRAFLEHERIFGFYYGTPKSFVWRAQEAGKDLLLCIDVKGAKTVRKFLKKFTRSIFILPPNLEVLSERLNKRSTESKKAIVRRLKRVKIELSSAKEYDYVVVNDDFKTALNKIKKIIFSKPR